MKNKVMHYKIYCKSARFVSICGIIGENVTGHHDLVTCKNCLKKLTSTNYSDSQLVE